MEELKVLIFAWPQNVPEFKVWTINTGYRASPSQLVCSIKVHNHQMNLETSARAERWVHVSRPPSCLTRQHRRTRKHSTDDHEEQIQAGSVLPPCDLDMHAHGCSCFLIIDTHPSTSTYTLVKYDTSTHQEDTGFPASSRKPDCPHRSKKGALL